MRQRRPRAPPQVCADARRSGNEAQVAPAKASAEAAQLQRPHAQEPHHSTGIHARHAHKTGLQARLAYLINAAPSIGAVLRRQNPCISWFQPAAVQNNLNLSHRGG